MSGTGSLPALPASMPQFPQSGWRRICAAILRLAGWHFEGTLPDLPKLVLIAAPHSSWWDGVWGLLLRSALGANVSFMAKRELFAGPLGWILRRLGGIPIERSGAHGVVEQMAARFADREGLWLGITPEGTRKRVAKWKSGFWHIARAARVPILPVYFDYPTKTVGIGPLFLPTSDSVVDIARLRVFYALWRGKHRGVV